MLQGRSKGHRKKRKAQEAQIFSVFDNTSEADEDEIDTYDDPLLVEYELDFPPDDEGSGDSSSNEDDEDEDTMTQRYSSKTIDSDLNTYFDSIASMTIEPVSFKEDSNIALLLAIAEAKQRYNLSNNAVTFILHCLQYNNSQNNNSTVKLPTTWNSLLTHLNLPTPYRFNGCALCGRYIFQKNDTYCQVCKLQRQEREVFYIPLMVWLKYLFANSSNFVDRLDTYVVQGIVTFVYMSIANIYS